MVSIAVSNRDRTNFVEFGLKMNRAVDQCIHKIHFAFLGLKESQCRYWPVKGEFSAYRCDKFSALFLNHKVKKRERRVKLFFKRKE